MVAVEMRGRLPPLVACDFQIAIDEDPLPGHKHIVEYDIAVGLVEPAAQWIVEGVGRLQGERAAWIELESGRADWDCHAVRVVLVARLQRMNAAQVDVIGKDP